MIQEEFLEFVLCDTGTSGQAIADKIKFTLEKLTLGLNDLQGQGYNGAGNMSGKYRGAAAIIQHDYPKALYNHCVSHVPNLCVVAACNIQTIRNMYEVVEEICLLFNNSPKRQQGLQEHIKNLPVGTTVKTKLVNLCKTQWVARIEAFEVFRDMLLAVSTLEVISTAHGWSADFSKKASALLISITQFQFLMYFEGTWAGFGFNKGLTISLQGQSKDIRCAYNEVVTVKEALSVKCIVILTLTIKLL